GQRVTQRVARADPVAAPELRPERALGDQRRSEPIAQIVLDAGVRLGFTGESLFPRDHAGQGTLSPSVEALTQPDAPYPAPAPGEPLRVAFVGQQTYFRATALEEHSERVETTFVDWRILSDALRMRAQLDAFQPHVVVSFRPEIIPRGLFSDL